MKKVIYPLLLFFCFMVLATYPEPEFLRDYMMEAFLGASLLLVPIHLLFAQKNYVDPFQIFSLLTIGVAGAFLTGVFWFRASSGSYAIEAGFALEIGKTLFFWAPSVVYAVLYRSDREGLRPGSRKVLLARMLVAFVASLAGMVGENVMNR